MPKRTWKQILEMVENNPYKLGGDIKKDEAGKLIHHPLPTFRTMIDFGFKADNGTVRRQFTRGFELHSYSLAERPTLELYGREWHEPSFYLDEIVDLFKFELEGALKDLIPWDGEF